MPCPFAPLLALLPGLPLVPWFLSKCLAKNKPFNTADSSLVNYYQGSKVTYCITLSESCKHLASFEFYKGKAPHLRKSSAIYEDKTKNMAAEFLLLGESSSEEIDLAKKLAAVLADFDIRKASIHSARKLELVIGENFDENSFRAAAAKLGLI